MHNPSTPKNPDALTTEAPSSRPCHVYSKKAVLRLLNTPRGKAIVLELLSNTIKFQLLPYAWRNGHWQEPNTSRSHFLSEYTSRFSGARDIIIFHAYWEDKEAAADLIHQSESPPGCPSPDASQWSLTLQIPNALTTRPIWTAQSASQKATVNVLGMEENCRE